MKCPRCGKECFQCAVNDSGGTPFCAPWRCANKPSGCGWSECENCEDGDNRTYKRGGMTLKTLLGGILIAMVIGAVIAGCSIAVFFTFK